MCHLRRPVAARSRPPTFSLVARSGLNRPCNRRGLVVCATSRAPCVRGHHRSLATRQSYPVEREKEERGRKRKREGRRKPSGMWSPPPSRAHAMSRKTTLKTTYGRKINRFWKLRDCEYPILHMRDQIQITAIVEGCQKFFFLFL